MKIATLALLFLTACATVPKQKRYLVIPQEHYSSAQIIEESGVDPEECVILDPAKYPDYPQWLKVLKPKYRP